MIDDYIAVPGGAGFIGSHLCERLLDAGHRVLALDDFSSGDPGHVAMLVRRPRFELQRVDIAENVPAALDGVGQIFNLACPASPAHYLRHPVQTALSSGIGTWRLLQSASRSGARLLQASTSEVYGDPAVHPQTEDYWGHVNPIGPRSCYDEGKRFAEAMCFAYHRERQVQIRVARLFNSYGPRLRPGDGRVVSNFIVQALRGEPLTIYGDGRQTRSFCYVDDTVEALIRLMRSPFVGPVNIGNPIEHPVIELAELVLRLTGSRSVMRALPLPVDDPQRRRPDISLATRELDWRPSVSLADGLKVTIEHFRRELGLSSRPVAFSGAG